MAETTTGRTAAPPSEPLDTGRGARAGMAAVRIAVGLLWIANSGWKTPPDFGRDEGRGLYRYVEYAVEYPVFPPFSWVMENLVMPNFVLFGYVTLLLEASLGAFLLVGLATRLWALLGMVQIVAITLSVLNAPNEFPWTYYMMFAAHLAILATAAGRAGGVDGLLRPVWRRSSGRLSALLLRAS